MTILNHLGDEPARYPKRKKTLKAEIVIDPYGDEKFSAVKKFFQNEARMRLDFAKEACRGLCSESKTTHNTTTNHA
jgi:hypothetical protein